MSKHCKHASKEEVVAILIDIMQYPDKYKTNEIWSKLAEHFSVYDLLDTPLSFKTYGGKFIDSLAKQQMELAMRLPTTVGGDIGCRMSLTVFDAKDHYIRSLNKDVLVVSLDAIRRKHKISPTDKSGNGRVVQMAKEEARSYLRKGQDFIWNATNITQQMRTQLVDLFVSYGAKVKIVYIEKPYDIWRKQNRDREYPLPESVLDKMLCKLEIPQLTEAHEVEYIVTE